MTLVVPPSHPNDLLKRVPESESKQHQQRHNLYCLIPADYRPTYRAFACAFARLSTARLAQAYMPYREPIAREKTVIPIDWTQDKEPMSFTLALLLAHIRP